MLLSATLALAALLPSLVNGSPVSITKRYRNSLIKSFRNGNCLSTQPGQPLQDGSLLTTVDCDRAVRWDINTGSGSVIISGTNFALDAGVNPSNNVPAKVWTSYPGLPQQTWFLTGDNRIAITGGSQCLDEGDNGPQTYQCTAGNTNQIWYVDGAVHSPTAVPTPEATTAPAPAPGNQLKFGPNPTLCATVQGDFNNVYNGVPVNMAPCQDPSSSAAATQTFWFASDTGKIYLAGSNNMCLDAGDDPSNGTQMKLWQCYDGLPQQAWSYPSGTGIFSTKNNQCLDVNNADGTTLQTWECSYTDPQQQFFVAY